MTIEEKAKTGLMIYHTILHETKGGERFQDHPWAKEEWVLVSDAQQEIDKLKTFRDNAYKKWCDSQAELERERGLLKQKLQTFYDTLVVIAPKTVKIEEYDKKTKELWIVQTADPSEWTMFIDSLGEWLVKFKELLK